MLRLLLVVLLRLRSCLCLALLACGPSKSSESAPQPDAPAQARPADAAPPERTRALAPGSWPHVTQLTECSVAVQPAPDGERTRNAGAARARLASLGGTATIQLTATGDRVQQVDWRDADRATRPPTRTSAKRRAVAFLQQHASLFGVSSGELATVRFHAMKVGTVPGVAWEVYGRLERVPDLAVQPVRAGGGLIVVDLDRAGRLVTAKVDRDVLPPVTLCTATLERDAIEAAVVGRELEWKSMHGPRSEGKLAAADIVRIEHTALHLPSDSLEPDAPLVIAAVYIVSVNRGGTWQLMVDPATAEVLRVQPMFAD